MAQLKLIYVSLYFLKIPLLSVALLTESQLEKLANNKEITFKNYKIKISFFSGWEKLVSQDDLLECINIFFQGNRSRFYNRIFSTRRARTNRTE